MTINMKMSKETLLRIINQLQNDLEISEGKLKEIKQIVAPEERLMGE